MTTPTELQEAIDWAEQVIAEITFGIVGEKNVLAGHLKALITSAQQSQKSWSAGYKKAHDTMKSGVAAYCKELVRNKDFEIGVLKDRVTKLEDAMKPPVEFASSGNGLYYDLTQEYKKLQAKYTELEAQLIERTAEMHMAMGRMRELELKVKE